MGGRGRRRWEWGTTHRGGSWRVDFHHSGSITLPILGGPKLDFFNGGCPPRVLRQFVTVRRGRIFRGQPWNTCRKIAFTTPQNTRPLPPPSPRSLRRPCRPFRRSLLPPPTPPLPPLTPPPSSLFYDGVIHNKLKNCKREVRAGISLDVAGSGGRINSVLLLMMMNET